MTNGDDIQRDLERLLAGANPSAAFAARVRARVADDGARRSRRAAFVWALGGSVCLTSLAWALVARRPAGAPVPSATAVSAAAAQPQAPRTSAQPLARADRSETGLRKRSGEAPSALANAAAVSAEAGDTRVLVPDDQRIALVHLLQRLHQGRATVPATIVPAYDKDGLLVPPEPIVIAPLAGVALADPDLKATTPGPDGPGKDKQQ